MASNSSRTLKILITGLALILVGLLVVLLVNKKDDGGAAAALPTSSATYEPVSEEVKTLVDGEHRLEADDPRAKGDVDAKIVMEIYSDFQCGHCKAFATETAPELQKFVDDGTIRIEYNSLPVLGDQSVLAAQAATAAANQGKFWEYHDELFAEFGQTEFTEESLATMAEKVGVEDLEKFKADLVSEETVAAVAAEVENGRNNLGLSGTPAFLLGYTYIPGNVSLETFEQAIADELNRPEYK